MHSVMKVWLMPVGGAQASFIAFEHPSSRLVRFNSCFAPVLVVLPPQVRFDLFPPPAWIKRAAGSANSPFFPSFFFVREACLICRVCLDRKLFTLSFWNFNSWMAVLRQVSCTVALDALVPVFLPSSLFLLSFSFLASFLSFLASFFFDFFSSFLDFLSSFLGFSPFFLDFLASFFLEFPLLLFLDFLLLDFLLFFLLLPLPLPVLLEFFFFIGLLLLFPFPFLSVFLLFFLRWTVVIIP